MCELIFSSSCCSFYWHGQHVKHSYKYPDANKMWELLLDKLKSVLSKYAMFRNKMSSHKCHYIPIKNWEIMGVDIYCLWSYISLILIIMIMTVIIFSYFLTYRHKLHEYSLWYLTIATRVRYDISNHIPTKEQINFTKPLEFRSSVYELTICPRIWKWLT